MEEETKALQVRFPTKMYDRLTEMARKSRRSLNAEIIVCLEEYFERLEALEEGAKKMAMLAEYIKTGLLPKDFDTSTPFKPKKPKK